MISAKTIGHEDDGVVNETPPWDPVVLLTWIFKWFLRIGFALVPSVAILYLYYFGNPTLRFVDYGFHELAIGVACSLSTFVSYITWRCYRHSGEPFLFWIALGLTGFTAIYLPHGILTRTADCNIWLFLIFGPASRVVMVACFFIALLQYGKPAHEAERRSKLVPLWLALCLFALVDALITGVIQSGAANVQLLRVVLEGLTIVFAMGSIILFFFRLSRFSSPLMWMYTLAMAAFAQASTSFLLASAWDHQWWLGHVISAAGFFILSYGIVEAFHTTRAFSTVYSQQEMMSRLEEANRELDRMASYDFLTGAANRRLFLQRVDEELARAERSGTPTALLLLDLDHFKTVNDGYGHQAGDMVLTAFVARIRDIVRLPDLIGRFGGEEFLVLLPNSNLQQAFVIAERIRKAMDRSPIAVSNGDLTITVSIGVAEFGQDGEDVASVLRKADQRLYVAKAGGRNQVISYADPTLD
jgi:diguanylate cyclase (GGDEF)-like protein